MFEIMWHVIM